MAALLALSRGSTSRVLLLGLDLPFSGLIAVAALSLVLELVDAQTPALFRQGADYQYVVMPLT